MLDFLKKTALFTFLTLTSLLGTAQEKLSTCDFGIMLGGSYYLGDLNPMRHFALTQAAGGVHVRYNIDNRFAARGSILYGHVMGDDSRSDSYAHQQRNLSFKSNIFEFAGVMEFNFIEYKIGSEKHPFTPYAFLGAAVFKFQPQADLGGNWVNLQPLQTEAQKAYKLTQFAIPFGVGVKVNLAKRLGLGIEWGMRKTFTDYIDDVSGRYADPASLKNQLAVVLADRSLIAEQSVSNTGRQRGNSYNKDWYNFTGITLNFKLNMKNEPCYSQY